MIQPTWESGEVLQPKASGPRRHNKSWCLQPRRQTYLFVHDVDQQSMKCP
jgi:hypothetical protein